MPFCPVCGKSIKRGQTFCEEHQENKLAVKPFTIRLCSCGRLFHKNHWFTPQSLEASVLKIAREHIKQRVPLRLQHLPIPEKRGHKTTGTIIATSEGEEHTITFPILLEQCSKCAKIGTQYYTAKLQLRNPPREALPYLEEYFSRAAEKGIAVNKIVETARGPDLYLTHKSAARELGEKLVRRFGGVMKQSEQLFSRNRQTSKALYRLNVTVEFPRFSVGDVVLLNGKAVLITGLGKQITGRNLFLDKKVVFTPGEEEHVLTQEHTTVITTQPHIEVIHPTTYQPVTIHNKNPPRVRTGQQVKVVMTKNHVFIV